MVISIRQKCMESEIYQDINSSSMRISLVYKAFLRISSHFERIERRDKNTVHLPRQSEILNGKPTYLGAIKHLFPQIMQILLQQFK